MPNTVYPSCPPRRRHSFAGPLVLILLGVLFLLGNTHWFPWSRLGYLFARYWPVLLILWGLIRLLEYFRASREGTQPARIGGGIVLILLIIFFGLAANHLHWSGYRISLGHDNDFLTGWLKGNPFSYSQDVQQAFPAGSVLRINDPRGNITINGSEQNSIRVVLHKKVWSDSRKEADQLDHNTPLLLTAGAGLVNLTTGLEAGSRSAESDLEIFLPKQAAVEVNGGRGDVSIHDRVGDVKVSISGGDVELDNIAGNATVNIGSHGSVKVANASGDVAISGHLEDINLADVGGSAGLNGEFYGTTNVARLGGRFSFKTSRTDFEAARVDGSLFLDSGDLNATRMTGPVRLRTTAKDIRLREVSGDVHLDDSNGDIDVHATEAPLGQIEISSRRGDVNLYLPASSGFQVNVRTVHGDIRNDFGIGVNSKNGTSDASGQVGNGGAKVQVNTEYGDVSIRKAG